MGCGLYAPETRALVPPLTSQSAELVLLVVPHSAGAGQDEALPRQRPVWKSPSGHMATPRLESRGVPAEEMHRLEVALRKLLQPLLAGHLAHLKEAPLQALAVQNLWNATCACPGHQADL
mmetsp:Transcript_100008/g.173540  ORF Transcript_100008/g.173540 Transcript_100008/m.173540 type:complete len:120 (-) Transcript_100008:2499-2858(-)